MNLDAKNSDSIKEVESQLDQRTLDSNDDSVDVSTQTLRYQVESNNIFASQVLKALRNEARHHNRISFVECEKQDNFLYFREKKYVLNSNRLRLRLIQLTYDSTIEEHSDKAKCYDLVNRAY